LSFKKKLQKFVSRGHSSLLPNKKLYDASINSTDWDQGSIAARDEFATTLDDLLPPKFSNKTLKISPGVSPDEVDLTPSVSGKKASINDISNKNPNLILKDDWIATELNKGKETIIVDTSVPDILWSTEDISLDHIPDEHRPKFRSLLTEYADVFATGPYDIGTTDLIEHHLEINQPPYPQKQRFLPADRLAFAQEAVRKLENAGIVRPITATPTCSNLILVPKFNTNDGSKAGKLYDQSANIRSYRICQDMRNLNNQLVTHYSTLNKTADSIIQKLAGNICSSLDALSAYYAIKLTPESAPLTSFYWEIGNTAGPVLLRA